MAMFLFFVSFSSLAQGRVVINEVMASCHRAFTDENGEADDWLELHSLSSEVVDVAGMLILVDQEIWEIPQGRPDLTRIPAAGYLVLWIDGQVDQGVLHAPFTLPKHGATLLLIDSDGSTLLDAFSYAEQRTDISFGRSYNDPGKAVFYRRGSPGAPNIGEHSKSILHIPEASQNSGTFDEVFQLELNCDEGQVYYTLDATSPLLPKANLYNGPVVIHKNTVLRAISFKQGNIESQELVQTYLFDRNASDPIVSLVVEPENLWHDSTGIYAAGIFDNFSQRGSDWERPAWFEFIDPRNSSSPYKVVLTIAGNGSRSLPKKSFSIKVQKRNGSEQILLPYKDELSGNAFNSYKLRADAAGGGHLKERFVYALNKHAGDRLVMQESLPVDLYLNGEYWGLYEVMPSKGEAFLSVLNRESEFDILTGSNGAVRKGDRDAYKELLDLAHDPRISSGGLYEEIANLVDLENFIDYWIFEVFTAKLDNSTNLRYWRPKHENERWRWITYDMDLWGDPNDNTIARVFDQKDLHEYPLPGLLIRNPLIRSAFINRMADLLNTTFDPLVTQEILKEVSERVEDQRSRDEARWEEEMEMSENIITNVRSYW